MRQNAEIRDTTGSSLFIQSFIFQWQLTSKVKGMMGNRTDSGKRFCIPEESNELLCVKWNIDLILFNYSFSLLLLLLSISGKLTIEESLHKLQCIPMVLKHPLSSSTNLIFCNIVFLKKVVIKINFDWVTKVAITSDIKWQTQNLSSNSLVFGVS